MIRLIVIAGFALVVATSAQGDPRAASSTGQLDHQGRSRLRHRSDNGEWQMRDQNRKAPREAP
jgi:hypothetical protein